MPVVDVGSTAPDFTLPDQEGRPVALSELLAQAALFSTSTRRMRHQAVPRKRVPSETSTRSSRRRAPAWSA